jgi:competence protein ComEA
VAATRQERLALGVAGLLLAAGALARAAGGGPPPVDLSGPGGDVATPALAAEVRDSLRRAAHRRAPLAPGERLDPNLATADDLDRLPRVGPALAARIVAHREANGPFHTLADLDAVPGVGPAVLREAAPHLALLPAPPPAPVPPAAARPARPPGGAPLDLNAAGVGALEGLPGIGPALARRIVATRDADGPFRGVDDLLRVPGIGPATLARLRPYVRVSP